MQLLLPAFTLSLFEQKNQTSIAVVLIGKPPLMGEVLCSTENSPFLIYFIFTLILSTLISSTVLVSIVIPSTLIGRFHLSSSTTMSCLYHLVYSFQFPSISVKRHALKKIITALQKMVSGFREFLLPYIII